MVSGKKKNTAGTQRKFSTAKIMNTRQLMFSVHGQYPCNRNATGQTEGDRRIAMGVIFTTAKTDNQLNAEAMAALFDRSRVVLISDG